MKKIYLIILLLLGINFIMSAEENQQYDYRPNHPEASTLIKYIENPVSYNIGVANISIPLYEIEVEGLKIPVTLTYYHKGLKPSELSIWLGQGWSLNVEPSIARGVNGKVDRYMNYNSGKNNNFKTPQLYYEQLINDSDYDEQPDQYFYKLPEKSGSFFLKSQDGSIVSVTSPFEPVQISKKTISNDNLIEITDENGVYYRFGISLKGDKFRDQTNNNVMAWKGTEIMTSTKKDTVFFDYYPDYEETTYHLAPNDIVSINENYNDRLTYGYDCGGSTKIKQSAYRFDDAVNYNTLRTYVTCKGLGAGYGRYGLLQISSVDWQKPRNENKTHRIKSISFTHGTVHFEKEKNALKKIKVKDKKGNIIREIEFVNETVDGEQSSYEGYINVKYPFLKQLTIKDKEGKLIDKYEFNNFIPNDSYINAYTTNINFWGYFMDNPNRFKHHGNSVNEMQNMTIYYEDKDQYPDSYVTLTLGNKDKFKPATGFGLINSMTSILGGKTIFVYEFDMYSRALVWTGGGGHPTLEHGDIYFAKQKAGGCRIKAIKHLDPYSNDTIIREFKYGEMEKNGHESGLGVIKWQITPEEYSYEVIERLEGRPIYSKVYTTSLIGDRNMSGVPIVYPKVTEYRKAYVNGILTDNGKTIYRYRYPHHEVSTGSLYNNSYKVEKENLYLDKKDDWKYGHLVFKEDYKRVGDDYIRVARKDYTYWYFKENNIPYKVAFKYDISENEKTTDYIHSKYNVYTSHYFTGCLRLRAEIDSVFSENGVIETKKEYEYDNEDHLFPTSIRTTNSDNTVTTKNVKYTLDNNTIYFGDANAQAIQKMKEKWIISSPLEENTVYSSGSSFANYYIYKNFENEMPLLNFAKSQKNDGAIEDKIEICRYNSHGKPVHLLKNNTENIVYIWSYNHRYPVLEIKNATYQEFLQAINYNTAFFQHIISAANPSDEIINSMGQLVRQNLPNALVNTYTFRPFFGMTSATDPRGVTTYYGYDAAGRLKENYIMENGQKKILETYDYHYRNQ